MSSGRSHGFAEPGPPRAEDPGSPNTAGTPGNAAPPLFATLTDAARALRAGTVSSRELVADALARADALDPVLGAYVTRFPDQATAAAGRADAAYATGGPAGLLHGVPVAVKDNLAAAEGPTTAQSPAHDPMWWRGRDAAAVTSLRTAGAVVLGKTTMVEYAVGRPEPAHTFPVPRNPWDVERWPGGSSSGNGAGIAAGLFAGALGTDTAGSVRLPAALCGITALKTTYGRLPRAGLLPLSWSQDIVGPMAVSARDCALLLAALEGAPQAPDAGPPPAGLRIGVPHELVEHPGVDAATRTAFEAALEVLRGLGARVTPFPLPEFGTLQAVNAVTMLTEGFAAHADRLAADWAAHGRVFRRLIGAGAMIPGHVYLKAQLARASAVASLLDRLGPLDVIATPTWPAGARRYADEPAMPGGEFNPVSAWNAAGFPALALPMGVDGAGMPLSLQLVGRPHTDFPLLAIGDHFQRVTGHHLRRPVVDPAAAPTPLPDLDAAARGRPVPTDASETARGVLEALGISATPADLAVVGAVADAFARLPALLGPLGPDGEPATAYRLPR